MGFPLTPIISNLYIEHFEELVVNSFPLKLRWLKCYVDDMNIFWLHGLDQLINFYYRLNIVKCHQL